ncbi:ABC transporter permease [Methanoregula sp.]|uniref:ABC transporter permease n=1 Tax=Methanoregula sp. TaxID=2052170 RepID=UPI002B90E725|nr:ABC transporter permease [Methanoregula sp.]HVP96198.1 ABC transporter permease [Methanoregula sp.]
MPSTEEKTPDGVWFERLHHELSAAWAISRKDMITYYIKPNIIVSGILFPLFMFLAFAIGKNAPPGTLIPGLIAITLLFSASSIEPVSIPIERRVKTFDRLLSAPISLHSLVFGESMSGFLYSLGIACLPLLIGVVVFGTPIKHIPVLIVAMALTAFCFATLGTLFAAYPTENVGEVMSMLNTFRLPLIFISGVFIPISEIPQIGQAIALFSPLTYGNDMISYAYTGTSLYSPVWDVIALFVFILLFQFVANRLYKKFNE